MSTSMPSRFISCTTCLPNSLRPLWCSILGLLMSPEESAHSLVFDQVECMRREVALIRFRLYPDRKELSAQVARSYFVEADVAVIFGIGRANVEVLVEEALGRVGVCINYQRRLVNLARLGANSRT